MSCTQWSIRGCVVTATERQPAPRRRPRVGALTLVSLAWIALLVFVAAFADLLPLRDPAALGIRTGEVARYEPPGANAWFGGDGQGRDLFAQTVHATRPVLLLATSVTVFSATLGVLVGIVAGYVRGRVDAVIMAIAEIMFAFPSLVLLFAISAIWGISMMILIPVFTILGIPPYARIVRGVTIALAEREFVDAARALGASRRRIVLRELAPLVALPAAAYAFLGFAIVIATEGALAFLGLGLEQDTWGSLINDGRGAIREAPHLAMIPATVMFVTIMAFNFVGDAVRSVLDPRPVHSSVRRRPLGEAPAPTPDSEALLQIRGLTTRFSTPAGDVTAVDEVSLDLVEGQTLGVVGESGSGKTMLLRSITGAFPVAGVERQGAVVLDGLDLLRASGRNPLFLHAPVEPPSRPYPRRMAEARSDYLRRHFDPAWIEPGPGAREALDRTLSEGGTVVGLLDVAPDRLEVRDRLPGQLLGRPLELPAGLLRLAADHRATVVPYHGRLENDVRILEIEPPLHGRSVEDLVEQTLARCEAVIRKRPWIWQNWLDVDGLFAFRESGPGDRSEE